MQALSHERAQASALIEPARSLVGSSKPQPCVKWPVATLDLGTPPHRLMGPGDSRERPAPTSNQSPISNSWATFQPSALDGGEWLSCAPDSPRCVKSVSPTPLLAVVRRTRGARQAKHPYPSSAGRGRNREAHHEDAPAPFLLRGDRHEAIRHRNSRSSSIHADRSHVPERHSSTR